MNGNVYLILPILLPIIAGLMIGLWPNISIIKAQVIVVVTSLLNIGILILGARIGHDLFLIQVSQSLSIRLNFDEIGLIFLTLVSIMWLLVSFVSVEYMSHEVNVVRFYSFYIISLGAMMGVGLSANLFTFYLFYEMMTLVTYPLVINQETPQAKKAGMQYLTYSLIGAALTLVAIMTVAGLSGSVEFVSGGYLQNFIATDQQDLIILVYFFAVLGYGAKAGLYPLHAWLPKAHPVAPAPASALLSGIITKAGVLGIIRLTYFVYGVEILRGSWAQQVLLILIVFTIFLGSLLAFKARQLKIRLAYSSISQVSYVLLGLLLMNSDGLMGSVLQILSHGMIKNLLFLTVGAIIFKTGKTYVDEICGEGKTMPITMLSFTMGSLALIGIPPLSGFVSKYYLAMASLAYENQLFALVAVTTLIISSMLTAGYLLPMIIKGFFPSREEFSGAWPDLEPTFFMTVPFLILAVGIVMVGIYPEPLISIIYLFISQVL